MRTVFIQVRQIRVSKKLTQHFVGAVQVPTLKQAFGALIQLSQVQQQARSTQAPSAVIFARGINLAFIHEFIFDDEAEANANDPILNSIEWAPRRQTLIAKRFEENGEVVYRFDIRIQGDDETVFLIFKKHQGYT